MDMKDIDFYEAPRTYVLEAMQESFICVSNGSGDLNPMEDPIDL